MTKEHFDLAVIVPLEEELHEFLKVFPHAEDRCTATQFRYAVETGSPAASMIVIQQETMGRSDALRSATKVADDFNVGMFVCMGIAGSMTDDLMLGDVCYTGSVIDVYDNSKASDLADGTLDIAFSPFYYRTNREITTALDFIRLLPEFRDAYSTWQDERSQYVTTLMNPPQVTIGEKIAQIGRPRTVNGTIVCASVSNSKEYNKKLRTIDRKIIAIETESGGIFRAADDHGIPALTIRGISDYADAGKAKLEADTGGAIRKIAAANAASFLKLQLGNGRFLALLGDFRQSRKNQQELQLAATAPRGDLLSVIRDLGEVVDGKLRELSPEFRLQPKGYRLPLPRVRETIFSTGFNTPSESDPLGHELIKGIPLVVEM
jgi:nucleoside phosphorylase